VFGDDCVCGTREQMMWMQVVLVELSHEEGIAWDFFMLYYFGFGNCKHLRNALTLFSVITIYGFVFLIER